jgi:hypothetical protein
MHPRHAVSDLVGSEKNPEQARSAIGFSGGDGGEIVDPVREGRGGCRARGIGAGESSAPASGKRRGSEGSGVVSPTDGGLGGVYRTAGAAV